MYPVLASALTSACAYEDWEYRLYHPAQLEMLILIKLTRYNGINK